MKEILINGEITAPEVRVLSDREDHLGVMKLTDALTMAENEEKDLILISPNTNPPLCKIQELGKYKYDLMKKERKNKKNQRTVETKEIRLGLNIDTHDFETKQKQANKFLTDGNKVKIFMRFRGREITFLDNGKEVVQNFVDGLNDIKIEKPVKKEGNTISTIVARK